MCEPWVDFIDHFSLRSIERCQNALAVSGGVQLLLCCRNPFRTCVRRSRQPIEGLTGSRLLLGKAANDVLLYKIGVADISASAGAADVASIAHAAACAEGALPWALLF